MQLGIGDASSFDFRGSEWSVYSLLAGAWNLAYRLQSKSPSFRPNYFLPGGCPLGRIPHCYAVSYIQSAIPIFQMALHYQHDLQCIAYSRLDFRVPLALWAMMETLD